jgi:site-specific recombinase XerD
MDVALEKAITGFRLSNEAKGLSKKTIPWYHGNLLLFHRWLEKDIGHPPRIEQVTTDQIRRYFTGLRTTVETYEDHPYHPKGKHPLAPSSICGYYTCLSSFFNWAVREELITTSPMKNVPRPRVPKFIPDPFSEAEIRALIAACKELPESSALRATAIILVLLDTGMRLNELLNLRMPNLDLETGRAKIFGKGSKERFVYLGKSTKRALWRYISLARAEPVLGAENVFPSEDGRPIPQRYLAHILAKVSKWGGVAKVHPHRFRRTAAIQFLRNGGNIFALQKLLGHETLDMVRYYVELASDDVAVAHQQASPVDGWRL